ncbi:D-glycero-alpha-D-manno-heptose-1,7-bisphosphate 7-phosphatase [Streptomyces sp. enrichment culture]|uniref:D-glycero-alpha-D-manno-heptose-1,7-bisphosphate 7-phosphatase n=1 Tax=Streptomyces sp. enrichment culture TaxID=1795815 RepID=UPI003F54EA41
MTTKAAVFLDRDGTLTEPRHYPCRPEDLVLQPGVASPLRALRDAGYALVLVTNQSGLARGLFDRRALDAMHVHLRGLLAASDLALDGIYVCPHHVDGTVPELSVACECRKPAPGMLLRAGRELGLDLRRSWMVGDFLTDVEAGLRAGCRTALVGPAATRGTFEGPRPDLRAADTAQALREIALRSAGSPAAPQAHQLARITRRSPPC